MQTPDASAVGVRSPRRKRARAVFTALAAAVAALATWAVLAPAAAAQAPQMDKAFAPASIAVGQTTTLTLTIANPDLDPKSWSFVDELDAGLEVASEATATDCPATTVGAPLGATAIEVDGTLAAGQASCTIAVQLMATRAGTLVNGAENFTTVAGILPPAEPAELDCEASEANTGALTDVFSECLFNDDPPSFDFTIQQAWATDGVTTMTYQTPVVGDLFANGKPAVVIGANRSPTGGTVHGSRLANDLHVYDGASGSLLHTITTPRYSWTSHAVATLADVTGDGRGEIVFRAASHNQTQADADAAGVATGGDIAGRLVAYAYDPVDDDWDVLWISDHRYDHVPDVGATDGARGGHGVGIADFNGDGIPEAYVGNQVFNARTGVRLAAGDADDPSGCSFTTGGAWCMWGQVAAADMDGDGQLELVAGNAVYKVEIADPDDESANSIEIWREADTSNPNVRDGFTAVADMDLDGTPDVIVSGRLGGETSASVVYVWDGQTGEIKGLRTGSQMVGANGSRGGPPMIGDVDGDGRPEAVVITTNRVRSFQVVPGAPNPVAGLDEEWTLTTSDGSGATSMSMFDFNNDGNQEIVYRDEQNVRILDGGPSPANPATRNLATFSCGSGTGIETPVIADIDGSQEARILAACGVGSNTQGNLRAYETASFPWAKTRPVWNQQSYFVAHINDDLSVPTDQFEHWTVFYDQHQRCSNGANRPLNAFQQQVTDLDGESGCPVTCADPELQVSKTSDPPPGSPVRPGDVIRYELTIENPSEGDAFNIEVTDDLSGVLDDAELTSGPTLDPPDAGTVEVVGDTLTFTGDVFRDQAVTIAYEVTVAAAGELGDGLLANLVVAEYSGCPGDGDCATEHPVVALTKDADPRSAVAGTGTVTYAYELSGAGPLGAQVDFVDVLPAGMTYVPGSVEVTPAFGVVNDYGGTDTLEVSGVVGSVPVSIVATVAVGPDAGCGADLDNQASATVAVDGHDALVVDSDDPTTPPIGDPTTVAVTCATDLGIAKDGPAIAPIGGEVSWTLTVTNHGPSASSGSTITDELPAGVTDPQTSTPGCAIVGSTVTCDVGPLAVDATHQVEISATAPDEPAVCFANSVSVAAAEDDPEPDNDSASAVSCTPPVTDLELEKSGPAEVEPGGEVAWTLTVTNHGPDPSSGSTVTDVLPAEVTDPQTSTPGCDIADHTLTCTVGALAVDATHQIDVTATAPGTDSSCFENAAAVTAAGAEADPMPSNDTATVETCTREPEANLSIEKAGPAVVDPGDPVAWTLTVTNHGPDPSSGSTVTDELPAAVTDPQTSTPGCDIAGHTVTCAVGPLAAGGEHEIEVTATAPATPSACFENSASVAGAETDPVPDDDDSVVRTCVTPVSDLSLEKSGPAEVEPGGEVAWTLTVTNHGPGPSSGSTVTDELPAGVTDPQTSTPGCDIAGHTLTCTVGALAVDATHQIEVTATAPDAVSTCIANDASVEGVEGDFDLGNNAASFETCTREPLADLDLEKSGPAEVEPGGEVAWTLTVTNHGPDPSSGSTVTDELPAGVTGPQTSTPGCDIAGHTLTCAVGPLAVDATHQIDVTATAPATPSTCVENSASVSGAEGDPEAGNDGASVETCTAAAADLRLEKSGPAEVEPGGEVAWTLTVTNHGPDPSSGSTVTDELPAGVTGPQTSTPGCDIAGHTLTCTVGALAVDATHQIEVTATAPADYSTCFSNEAAVAGQETDLVPGNDGAVVETCTRDAAADLGLAKSGPAVVEPDGEIVWTLAVTNHGPDPSSGSTITDPLPSGVTDPQTATSDCDIEAGVLTCAVGALAVDATHEIVVTARAPATPGCLLNQASVTGADEDPVATNADAAAETCVQEPTADLALSKSGPAVVDPGGEVAWKLTVTNRGPDPSSGSTVTDVLPAEVTGPQTSTPGCDIAGHTVTCAVGPLAVDATHQIDVTAAAPATPSSCFANQAEVAGAEVDPRPVNDAAVVGTCTAPPSPQPASDTDLGIAKSGPARIRPGGRVAWRIAVVNHGSTASAAATVTDILPKRVRDVRVATPGCALARGAIACPVPPLAAGESAMVRLSAAAPGRAGACFANRATVRGGGDPNPANDQARARTCTTGAPAARLSIAKRSGAAQAHRGAVIPYRITVRNRGTAPARGVRVCDRPPADLRIMRAPGARRTANGRVCWQIARLAPRSARRFRVVAQVMPGAPGGMLTNRARVVGRDVRPAAARAGVRVRATPGACTAVRARASC